MGPHAPHMLGPPSARAANEPPVTQPCGHHLRCAHLVARLFDTIHKPREHSKSVAERPHLSPVVLCRPSLKIRKTVLEIRLGGRWEQAPQKHFKATSHNGCAHSAHHPRSHGLPGVAARSDRSTSTGRAPPGAILPMRSYRLLGF